MGNVLMLVVSICLCLNVLYGGSSVLSNVLIIVVWILVGINIYILVNTIRNRRARRRARREQAEREIEALSEKQKAEFRELAKYPDFQNFMLMMRQEYHPSAFEKGGREAWDKKMKKMRKDVHKAQKQEWEGK